MVANMKSLRIYRSDVVLANSRPTATDTSHSASSQSESMRADESWPTHPPTFTMDTVPQLHVLVSFSLLDSR